MSDDTAMMEDTDLARWAGMARLAYFTPLHEHPSLADRKATFILGATGLLVTILLFFLQAIIRLAAQDRSVMSILILAGLIVLGLLLLASARWAYMGYTTSMPAMPDSLAHYRNIAELDRSAYLRRMKGIDHKTALRAVLDYNYSVACQAVAKYRLVNRALKWMRVAIGLWMVLLLVIAIRG